MNRRLSEGGAPDSGVRLVALRDVPVRVEEAIEATRNAAAGGIDVFVGVVRDEDGGRPVELLSYSAHPSAEAVLAEVAERVSREHPGTWLAAVHRVGDLAVGDLAVVVAASAPHREEAFAACRALIEAVKHEVPIWKHQRFRDGGQEWVGAG